MKVLYIGPEDREGILNEWAAPGTTVVARKGGGPECIESMYDEYLSVPPMLEEVIRAQREGFDAVLTGCFGDPGLDAAREIASIPIVGTGEAGMLTGAMLGYSFSIVTILDEVIRSMREQVYKLGLNKRLGGIWSVGMGVMDVRRDKQGALKRMAEVSLEALEQDRSDVIVLGCGSMSMYADELSEMTGVPAINSVKAGLKTAEMLVASGLTYSKRAYPYPTSLRAEADAAS